MKRIFQTVMIMSALAVAVCSCKKDKDYVPVGKVELNKTTATIAVGGVEQLQATILPANATNKTVRWSSDNASIASVTATGLVTGVAPGLTVIRVTDASGTVRFADCAVAVQEAAVAVTGVSINKSTATVSVNGSETLNHSIAPSNATNKNVVWSSNNTSVATVDGNGTVTGISTGTATVTLTSEDGGLTSSCVVTVTGEAIPVAGVAFDTTAVTVYDVYELQAKIIPENATNKRVTWSSSDVSVVTVDDDGVVRVVSTGTAVITVTTDDGGFTATCSVTVENETGEVVATGWSAPPQNSYEYSMTFVAQVAFRGTLSTDVNTEVAAFVGDELRGYAKLFHEPTLDVYLIHLIIHSNSAGNETVSLKAYNPTKQRIYKNCKEFVFHGDTSLGSASEILNCMP
jgi:uncharacterized protein YjdB